MQQTLSKVIGTMSAERQDDVNTSDTSLVQTTNSVSAMSQLKLMCNNCKKMLAGYEEITKHICYKLEKKNYKHDEDHYVYTETTKTCIVVEGTSPEKTDTTDIFELPFPNEGKVSQHAT